MSVSLDSEADKISYALGMDIGASFRKLPVKVNAAAAVAGIQDVFGGQKPQLSREDFVALMQKFQQQLHAAAEQHGQELSNRNRQQQIEFLSKNKDADGVTVTASGLQYQVISTGSGVKPGPEDVVRVHYTGRLLDGTTFDSSVERGEPAEFPVNGVIAGWTEALQLMQVGSKYQLFIPANLAYGSRGAGQAIGPDQMLIFEVELLDIVG